MKGQSVTVEEICAVSGLSRSWVRRKLIASIREPEESTWKGAMPHAIERDGELLVALSTLPVEIREAFVMLDQRELPLTPPGAS